MSNFILKLEAFAGSGIHNCAAEAQALAYDLGVVVNFSFNSIECYAKRGGQAEWLVRNFHQALSIPSNGVIKNSAWSHHNPNGDTSKQAGEIE